ncbi:hypothetical protein [Luteibacter sp. E-22]|uniref:hypothetical protein n=1 Tax=Luteibacter sp. E-22 TaxID=3404050 RepID=UPI003CEE408C
MLVRLGWLAWLGLVAACIWLTWHALFDGAVRDHDIQLVALSHNPVAAVDARVRQVLEAMELCGEAHKLNVIGDKAGLRLLDLAQRDDQPSNMSGRTRR